MRKKANYLSGTIGSTMFKTVLSMLPGTIAVSGYNLADTFFALTRYPLYEYSESSMLRCTLFCLSDKTSFDHSLTLLQTLLWCGQMLDRQLHLFIVTNHAEEFRQRIAEKMPLL